MAGLAFDTTFNSEPVTKGLEKIQKEIHETAKAAELSGGRIDAAFNRISLKGLERIYELMQGFPKEIQGLESFKKQMADLEKRLEQANKKIVELQNQAKQPITVRTNTSEVAKETFAYDSLLKSLNDILGARGQNVAAMLREQNAIKLNQRELKVLEDIENRGLKLSDAQQTRRIQLTNSIMQHKQAISSLQQVINNEVKLEQVAVGSMAEMNQSLGRMRMAYRQLTEEERNSKFGQDLLSSIQQADAKIKELDASIGNHQRNVGDYSKQWNGLGMSIQQIGREFPSLAYGPKVFFSAISNNLPILADELKRAKNEFNALKSEGKDATPVWKQVASSLFSWNTALTVGITLLTLYGDKLVDWVAQAINGKDKMEEMRKTMLELNKIEQEANSIKIKTRSEIDNIISSLQSFNGTKEQEKRKIDELNSKYGSIFGTYNSLSQWYDILIQKGDDYIDSLFAQAKAQSYIQKAIEADQKVRETKAKGKDEYTPFWGAGGRVYQFFGGSNKNQLGSDPTQLAFDKAISDAEKERDDALANAMDLQKQYLDGIKKAGLFNYSTLLNNTSAETLRKEQEKYNLLLDKQKREAARMKTDSQHEIEQIEINGLVEGSEKVLRQRALNHDKEIETIKREAEDKKSKAIEEARSAFEANPDNKKGTFDADKFVLSESTKNLFASFDKTAEAKTKTENTKYNRGDDFKGLLDEYQDYTDKRLAIETKYNNDLETLEEQRKQAVKDGDTKQIEQIDRAIAQATKKKGMELMGLDYEQLKESPEYVRAFENLKETSSETLNSLLSQLEKAKGTAAKVLSPDQLREYTTTIQEIMDELDARNPFQALIDRKQELAQAEKELAKAQQELEAVRKHDAKIEIGVKNTRYNEKTGKIESEKVYLSATEALNKYNASKDKAVKANAKVEKAEKEVEDVVVELSAAIKGVGDAIGGPAGEIVSLMGDIGMFAMTTMNGIDVVSKKATTAIQAVEKASVILSIISSAIQILQKISELGNNKAFKQYETYAEKLKEINALTDAVNQYRIAALEAQQTEANWFSEDNLQNLRDYKKLHDEVAKAYADKVMESQATYQNESGGGWLTGAFNWIMGNMSLLSGWDKWKNIWGQGDYDAGQTAAVNNLRIETRKKSSGFLGTGIGAKSQKTEDLVSWMKDNELGDLFDKEGMINKEAAQSLIDNYGNKLVGQTKETLESLIKLREQYDEYIQQLHEYVSSLYEPLVDNMVDSLWDWLDNGKDALKSFKDYASGTFREIVSDMMRTIVLDKVIGSFSDDIAGLYEKYASGAITEEELMKMVADKTSGLMDNYEKNIPTLENILSTVNGYLKDADIDLKKSESSSQEITNGGFQTMSQDTGSELNGRFTALQISNEEIKNSMLAMLTGVNLISTTTVSNGITLMEIKNVALMSNSHLEDIAGFQKRIITNLDTKLANIERSTKIMAGS